MSLLFMDSFDHYLTADILQKWTSVQFAPVILPTGGRRSSGAVQLVGTGGNPCEVIKGLTSSSPTVIIGAAVKTDLGGGSNPIMICGVYDGAQGRDQWGVQMARDGSLTAYHGTSPNPPGNFLGTPIGTTGGGILVANVFSFLEVKVTIHNTAGTFQIKVNGLTVLNLTNVNTSHGFSTAWTSFWFGNGVNSGCVMTFDDVYVLDGLGAAPWNNFLGDCRVDPRRPTGVGASSAWTPTAGANWTNVNDATPNGDTSTVQAATVGLVDTYVTQDAPVPGAPILGVQHCFSAKKLDAGGCTIAPIVRQGGTNFPGVDLAPNTAYSYMLAPQQTNPATGAAWLEADFNAAEFGVSKTT